jgi:hypothetical protein
LSRYFEGVAPSKSNAEGAGTGTVCVGVPLIEYWKCKFELGFALGTCDGVIPSNPKLLVGSKSNSPILFIFIINSLSY